MPRLLPLLALLVTVALPPQLTAQQTPAVSLATLRREIETADSLMFAAYNAHDTVQIRPWFAADLEFYHDKGGLMTREQALAGLAGVFASSADIRRTLVGQIEVYPVPGYGAIEVGVHQFCHTENGADDCGSFKFLQVWRRTSTGWQVSRVVSYDH